MITREDLEHAIVQHLCEMDEKRFMEYSDKEIQDIVDQMVWAFHRFKNSNEAMDIIMRSEGEIIHDQNFLKYSKKFLTWLLDGEFERECKAYHQKCQLKKTEQNENTNF